jgi:methyl-accepting chemotaxis protein
VSLASELKSRFVIFLRQTEIGDRRRHDRLPCKVAVTLQHAGAILHGHTIDLSEGGMLVQTSDKARPPVGTIMEATIFGVGTVEARVANASKQGMHFEFMRISDAARAGVDAKLAAFREENKEFIERAIGAAAQVSAAFEDAISSGKISLEALFDNDYVLIAGTNPTQYRTRFLELLDSILPPIQNPHMDKNQAVLCVAIDRNGYIPVHRPGHSLPQRPGDIAWNSVHSRNRRIYDDPERLAAARNTRPYLMQQYTREVGGKTQVLRPISAPVRVFGKHWGAVRISYVI